MLWLSVDHVVRRLQELEKTIRTEQVPVDWDRTILWVDATLNGKPGHMMMIAPGTQEVRLSARVAATLGVRPANDVGGDEIALVDGRTVQARRGRLESVQVGPFTADDVECRVLPEEYGEAPSLLGGSFLKRFATIVDGAAGTLVLTQVNVKPVSRAARGALPKTGGTLKSTRTAPPPGRPSSPDTSTP
jgi:hypothetical protein